MRVLLDQGVPVPLRRLLAEHEVATAYEPGWSRLRNGELLAAAEADAFDVFVTTDKNLRYQQNLVGRRLAIVVLWTTSWPGLERFGEVIAASVAGARSGGFTELAMPGDHS